MLPYWLIRTPHWHSWWRWTLGVGAVLGHATEASPLQERNYDVGDRELLAVVKALKVWRHWIEGAKHPFLIWTDHRNLEYIRAARRLNPRQARWAIFFNLISFHHLL
jgi:hypothetical protein